MPERHTFNFDHADDSWQPCLREAIKKVDSEYLEKLYRSNDWLPGHDNIFNAFSLPIQKINYILIGESPYPRAQSANGYAFWDNAVTELWSETGLSKAVNRATSLRNIIKMLLIADGALTPGHTSQTDIANLNKKSLVQTNHQFFNNLLQHGFLLLNASLVLQPTAVRKDADHWRPFIRHILKHLAQQRPSACLILLGNIANIIDTLLEKPFIHKLYAEHPYNISFIQNPEVIEFFKHLHLLRISV
jgi:uracil-DNA glycosylase